MAIEPIENGEDGLSVRTKLNTLLAESSVYLPSRSDLVSFIAGGGAWPDGAIVSDGTVAYLAQADAAVIPDLLGLVPHGLSTPNHFAENAIPSATDMSDALAASMSYGPTTLLGEDYLVTKVSRIYARDGASLEGVGRQNDSSTSSEYRSRILLSGGGTYDAIDLYTGEVSGEGVPLSCRNITFKNVTFATTGAEPTGGAYIKCSDRPQNMVIDECSFDDGYSQLDLLAPLEMTIKNCGFGGTGRTSAAGDAITFSPDTRATDGIERKAADVHIYSNQFKEVGTAQFRSFIRILAADGIYGHDNHFQNSREDHIRIDPSDGGDPTESVASVVWTDNYFDSSNRYHVYMTGQKTKYRDLAFNGNQFRAAAGVSSITASATIAISRVRIIANTFRDCDYSAIRCVTTPAPDSWIINDNVFSDNNVLNDSQHGDIRLNGDHMFSGNMFQGGGSAGYAINLDGSASVVSGNDLTQSDASLVILGGSSASVFGNAGITNPGTVAKASDGFNTVSDLIADESLSYSPAQYFETTVAAGDVVTAGGYTDVVASAGASDHHLTTAGGVKIYADEQQQEVSVSSGISFVNGSDLNANYIFTQDNSAEIATIATVNLSNVTADTRRAHYRLAVDGNRDNNTAAVTGIDATKIKRGSNAIDFAAFNCDTGIRIAGNVEVAMIDCHADTCGTGVLLEPDGANTPDELILRVNAHDCDTFFETTGTTKMSGHITFGCEQSNSWGAIIENGWFELAGIIRGCGLVDGGCLKTGDYAVLRGSIQCAGGDDANCEWAASIEGGELHGLHITASSSFANGVRIIDGAEGSARIVLQTSPFTTGTDVGVQIGVSGGTAVNGFVILPGSEMSGTTALNLDNAIGCDIDCASIVGDVLIGASSRDNTIRVPRRNAEVLATFTNNSSNFNKIIFKGNYTLSEMNTFNGGTAGSGCFVGMEVEQCQEFDGARCYFDGNQWVPSHGVLATGTATIPIGSKNISVAHGLGYDPGNHALQIMFETEAFGLGSVRGNVTSTNVVILGENNVVGTDVDFVWTLRKTD